MAKRGKTKVIITDALQNDLKKCAGDFCVGLAARTRDELTSAWKEDIEDFYNHWRPNDGEPYYYRRHYINLRNNSFEKYYSNPHHSRVYGGVKITNNLKEIYRSASKRTFPAEGVLNLFLSGHHGMAENFPNATNIPPVMSPTPLEKIIRKRLEIVDNINYYEDSGYERIKRNSYSTLHIR